MPLLEVKDLSVSYGSVRAVRNLDLHVDQSEIVALLGGNGAGKTSTLNAIAGLVRPSSGSIVFDGAALEGHPPEVIVRRGVSLAPEGRQVFAGLTVIENLRLGGAARRDRVRFEAGLDSVFELFPVLKQRRNQAAGTLSGGEQQQLTIARCLMSEPRLLLLDEPSLGLAPQIVDRIFDLIVELRQREITILLVEQNVDLSLAIADRGYVLASGELALQGSGPDLRSSSEVERTYLGIGVA